MRMLLALSVIVGCALLSFFLIFSQMDTNELGSMNLGVIDKDESSMSTDFKNYLETQLGMTIVDGDEDYLQSELIEKHISGIVEVPKGFEKSLLANNTQNPMLVTYADDYENRVFLDAYLEQDMT
jgi:hypothetical protein